MAAFDLDLPFPAGSRERLHVYLVCAASQTQQPRWSSLSWRPRLGDSLLSALAVERVLSPRNILEV